MLDAMSNAGPRRPADNFWQAFSLQYKRPWMLLLLGAGWVVELPLLLRSALRLHQNAFLVFQLFWILSFLGLCIAVVARIRKESWPFLAGLGAIGGAYLSRCFFQNSWLGDPSWEIGAWALFVLSAFLIGVCGTGLNDKTIRSALLEESHGWTEAWLALLLASFCLWICPLSLLFGNVLIAVSVISAVFLCGVVIGWAMQRFDSLKISGTCPVLS